MNTRQCLTKRSRVVHQMEDGETRLCGYRARHIEPELPGTKQAWRVRTRDMRTCLRCSLAFELMAEA